MYSASAAAPDTTNPSVRVRMRDLRGHWALVTGASSGIGREFARHLASAGMHLVLVARRADRLNELATELSDRHGSRILALPVDLAQSDAVELLRERLREEGIRIRLLVNNAALGHWAVFEAASLQVYEEMIRVNIQAVTALCHTFRRDLASHPCSAIVNVSSPAAFQPVPYMAVYAASKAFVHSFSLALHEEWRKQGILVQTLLPGPTPTELPGAQAGGGKGIARPAMAAFPVRASLRHMETGSAIVITARRTFWQRIFALLPARMLLRQVGRMFTPEE